jgi:hypothetical protein
MKEGECSLNIGTLFTYCLFAFPVIFILYLLIRLLIVDPIADRVEDLNYKKYIGTDETMNISTYQNDNITHDDIMYTFVSQCNLHKQRYFISQYKVYSGAGEQNYAWSVRTTKDSFGWGTVTHIQFHFSNGWICFSTSAKRFTSGDESSGESILHTNNYSTRIDMAFNNLEQLLVSCRNEAILMWKMNGKEANGNLPFNFYFMLNCENTYFNSKNGNKKSSFSENGDNSKQPELFAFYRTLLGLKLHFSQDELKTAYREAIKKYHPDSYGSSTPRDRANAEILMKQINEANEFLRKITA